MRGVGSGMILAYDLRRGRTPLREGRFFLAACEFLLRRCFGHDLRVLGHLNMGIQRRSQGEDLKTLLERCSRIE